MVKGWMCIPGPFECEIRVRGEERAEVIEREWREAEKGIRVEATDALI